MDTIAIAKVLSEIRSASSATTPFLLVVVKSTNRTRGAIRTYAKCLKGFPSKTEKTKVGSGQGQFSYKETDTIPIIDLEAGDKFRTIPISHIIGYNQYKVIH
jgi:hypothetical protein